MIEGIKIEMATEVLRKHIQERAQFHQVKAEWYASQSASLREGTKAEYNVSNDPVSSLERSKESHRERAAFFSVLEKHLIPHETYRLSQSDLTQLEFASRYL